MPWLRPRTFFLMALWTYVSAISGCEQSQSEATTRGAAPDPLDQNWDDKQLALWRHGTQGSRLMPLQWFVSLEQPSTAGAFLDASYLETFRYRLDEDTGRYPRLPLGFVPDDTPDESLPAPALRWKSDQQSGEAWVGLTCAACHTGTITYRGTRLTVNGGATMADYQSFIEALDAALRKTASGSSKFQRFAQKALGNASLRDAPLLRAALNTYIEGRDRLNALNATTIRYGFGRLDAVGQILNRVALFTGAENPTANPPNAPVSYPFLWNVPQQTHVQWNGMAMNAPMAAIAGTGFDLGALGRNTGEVIGVFADVSTESKTLLGGYRSSTNVESLEGLEKLLGHLRPPRWPEDVLGRIDDDRSNAGSTLYDTYCKTCHARLRREDLLTREIDGDPIDKMLLINKDEDPQRRADTDIWMACNTYLRRSASGRLEGLEYDSDNHLSLGAEASLSNMLQVLAKKVLIGKDVDVLRMGTYGFIGIEPEPWVVTIPGIHVPTIEFEAFPNRAKERAKCLGDKPLHADRILAYKARPLGGIWATAPYLHNGSVSSLYELLLPPEERKPSFNTGSLEYDPEHVGFVTNPLAPGNSFVFDTSIPGNSNEGHNYGASELDDTQRMQLVEFLKSL